ncbi:KTSC domain-containing protein [Corallococcus interemptor]|uniref:KTSC domain-containing protein n=1 Tax=Corallococcus TaxID=83461 RepID=UPI001CBCDB97|nr:KTSC domain-containing protein [Corallococcus sp. AS-1-12]MBZ4333309.1 KTSC domain-containing protein [Corallococcus sp. AS-1-12]
MNRIPVSSSNILSIGYDPASQTLEVEFNDSRLYEYLHVPASLHRSLMQAPSKGGFLDAFIKKGGFQYRQVR